MPIFKRVNKNFFKKWTPEMAYVLGFFAADGYMTLNKRGARFWSIQITDKNILVKIKTAIQSEHKISRKIRNGNEKDIHRLQIGSKEMCNDLYKLGMKENKTNSLSVPNVPSDYFRHFVRGYFDGDGHVWSGLMHKGRGNSYLGIQTVFTSCSLVFLETLDRRLQAIGVTKGAIQTGKENYSRLIYSVHGSLKLYDFMYNGLGSSKLFLRRKKKRFDEYIKLRA